MLKSLLSQVFITKGQLYFIVEGQVYSDQYKNVGFRGNNNQVKF